MKKGRVVNSDLAGYLKYLRQERGFTLREVENATGISAGYLNRIERGERKTPTLPVIELLAKCYGIDPILLFQVAINSKNTNIKQINEFEGLVYSKDFTICGQVAKKEIKDALVSLISTINNLEWSSESKYNEIPKLLQEIDNFKMCIG